METAQPLLHIAKQVSKFIEAAVHLILCIRCVYPKETFFRKRIFGCFTWWSESAILCDYIAEVMTAVQDAIRQKLLSKVNLLILETSGAVNDNTPRLVEKFVFDLTNFDDFWCAPPLFISPLFSTPSALGAKADDHLNSFFRESLVKLHFVDLLFASNSPSNLTFHIQIETRLPIDPSMSQNASHHTAGNKHRPPGKDVIARFKCSWLPSQILNFDDATETGLTDSHVVKTLNARLLPKQNVLTILQISLDGLIKSTMNVADGTISLKRLKQDNNDATAKTAKKYLKEETQEDRDFLAMIMDEDDAHQQ